MRKYMTGHGQKVVPVQEGNVHLCLGWSCSANGTYWLLGLQWHQDGSS